MREMQFECGVVSWTLGPAASTQTCLRAHGCSSHDSHANYHSLYCLLCFREATADGPLAAHYQ